MGWKHQEKGAAPHRTVLQGRATKRRCLQPPASFNRVLLGGNTKGSARQHNARHRIARHVSAPQCIEARYKVASSRFTESVSGC